MAITTMWCQSCICGHSIVHHELEAVCERPFPSEYVALLETYGVQDDIMHSLWNAIIVVFHNLLTQQLW